MSKWRGLWLVFTLSVFAIVASGCLFGQGEEAGSEAIDPPQEDYISEGEDGIEFDLSEGEDGTIGGDEDGAAGADESIEGTEENADESVAGTEEDAEGTDDGTEEDGEGTGGGTEEDGVEEEASGSVERTIYVFDDSGYVVPLTIEVPQTNSVAQQALEYLVVDGPVTEHLPDGMRAVLPPQTQMSVNIKEDKTAEVDFSSAFTDYAAEDEKGILEAITWTLTEFEGIQKVELKINGNRQEVMPVNETPISGALSRENGINLEMAEGTKAGNSSMVTLYFQAQTPSGAFDYYVPVSRIIPRTDNLAEATVKHFIAGPSMQTGLHSGLDQTTQVLSADLEDEVAVIDLDEKFLSYDSENSKASDAVVQSLVLSVVETGVAEEVQLSVNGETELVTMEGKTLSEPVARSGSINAAGF